MGGVVAPSRRKVRLFPFVAVILILGGFLWHSCRTWSIILEVCFFVFVFVF
jgi:hypothetical protein